MGVDFYAVLDLPYDATSEEIRNAYFRLARMLHPDANPDPGAPEKFIAVQQAYEVLSNAQRRSAYDASLPTELIKGPEISVTARYSVSAVRATDEPQLAYVLLEMMCTAETDPNNLPPCHMCLVLDRSTSMAGDRMDMVKSSALNLLQQLRSQDVLSVVTFSDRADVIIPPTRASAISRSDSRISLLQCGGGTEIYQGLSVGIEQLQKTKPSILRHLILLTDGHTYGDERRCLEIGKEAAKEGVVITVLGIGHEWNDDLMDQLAASSGGNSMFVSSAHELDRFLQRKLADINNLYARSMTFDFQHSEGVQLRFAFRLTPNTGPLPLSSPVLLGDLQHRKNMGVLLEFLLPPLTEESDRLVLAHGPIWMDLPGRGLPKVRLTIDLARPVRQLVEHEIPPAVIMDAMSKLTLYRMQEKVRNEVTSGQVDKATRHLQYIATHLLSRGDRELAHTVLVEAEHIQQTHQFSKDGDKRIKYGTRSLLLPAGPESHS